MSKGFIKYLIGWVILFVSMTVIALLLPVDREEGFWIGYILIVLALLGQLFCACYVFGTKNATKIFYRIPLMKVAYIGLIVIILIGIVCMALGDYVPVWIGGIFGILVLSFEVLAILKGSVAVDIVEAVDERNRTKTAFVKSFTVDSESLMSQAKTMEIREECRKVYEAGRYSDPMSVPELESIEQDITWRFGALKTAVASGDINAVKVAAEEVLHLIEDRNRRCKALK